jgi:hypothetical protein
LALGAAAITSIPFWEFEGIFKSTPVIESIVFGGCMYGAHVGEDWPLLPWIFYPLLAFSLGRLSNTYKHNLSVMTKTEAAVWSVCALVFGPYAGEFLSTPIASFACATFRHEFFGYWASQLLLIFILRVSFLERASLWLHGSRFFQRLSRLSINRRFYIAYFIHYPVVYLWSKLAHGFNATMVWWVFPLGIAVTWAISEVVPIVLSPVLRDSK